MKSVVLMEKNIGNITTLVYPEVVEGLIADHMNPNIRRQRKQRIDI